MLKKSRRRSTIYLRYPTIHGFLLSEVSIYLCLVYIFLHLKWNKISISSKDYWIRRLMFNFLWDSYSTYVSIVSIYPLFRTWYQQQIDRGSVQMVEHQMIYSPGRKNGKNVTWQTSWLTFLRSSNIDSNNLLTLLAADPPSSCPEWVLLHFFSRFPISAGLLLTLFPRVRRAEPLTPICP